MPPEFAPLAARGAVLGDEVYTALGEAILDVLVAREGSAVPLLGRAAGGEQGNES